METQQPNQENQDQQVNPLGEEQGSSQVRSYECTFCRRGFSNAQALGGHMNIHRRDKVKLKHSSSSSSSASPSSNEPQQSLDTTKIISIPPPFSTNPLMEAKFSEDRSSIIWPWILDKQIDDSSKRNKTYAAGIMQLPLFDDKPSSKDQQQQQHSRTEKDLLLSSYDLSSSELDLELRLGPEPQGSSSPATDSKSEFLPRN